MIAIQETLEQQYNTIMANEPNIRIRDAAKKLGVGEAALVALKIGNGVIALKPDFKEILLDIHTLGRVMALTRNDNAVHERKGVYNNVSFEGPVGMALNEDIDLRLFLMHWKSAFAVDEQGRKSIQFFDKAGDAVHKIYLLAESNQDAYNELLEKYSTTYEPVNYEVYPAAAEEIADADIDVASFRKEWLELKDTHDFFGLTRKYKVSRTQALRLAPEGYVAPIATDAIQTLLEQASAQQVPVMVFIGSRGCIQIHTGTVTKLMATGPWYNVLDEAFNMHLKMPAIASAYIVKKPSVDGIVNSIELFDNSGEMIVQFFGKRKPGIPELEEWRQLVASI